MNEYIERSKLKEYILDDLAVCGEPDAYHRPIAYGTMLGLKGALSYVNTLPAADVEKVRYGKWMQDEPATVYCSECSYRVWSYNNTPYCPKCGAKMDGGKE